MEKSSLDILPNISIWIQWKKISQFSLLGHLFLQQKHHMYPRLLKQIWTGATHTGRGKAGLPGSNAFLQNKFLLFCGQDKSEQVHILAAVAARDQNAKSCRKWQTTHTQVIPVGTVMTTWFDVTLHGLGTGQSTRQASSDQSCCLIGQVSHHWGGGATTTYHITSELFKWGSAILCASQL